MPRSGPRVGDLFTVRGRRLVGRVISTSAVVGPTHGSVLVYVYADARLSRDALLVPPMLTTRAPWSHGLFELLRSEPLLPGAALEHHAFRNAKGELLDEEGRPSRTGQEVGPVGEYRLLEVEAIEAILVRAPAEYEAPPPGPGPAGDVSAAVKDIMARWVAAFGRPPTRDEWQALYDVALADDDDGPKLSS